MRFVPLFTALLLSGLGLPAAAQPSPPIGDGAAVVAAIEQSVVRAVERAGRSVVAIARVPKPDAPHAAANFTFNVPTLDQVAVDPTDPDYVPTFFASGVILSSDGLILTCYHVLDDPRQNEYYVWWQGKPARATVVPPAAMPAAMQRSAATVQAGDPWTDLAVLKIDAAGLPAMPMGDASELRRGSFVISLGNPYATARDGQASASWGIVSNLQRSARPHPPQPQTDNSPVDRQSLAEFGTLIQTDARLNLGSSGGALVNLQGEMVGLTTSLASVAGFEQAAGYAIPIDAPMLEIIDTLRQGRQPSFGFLGVEPSDTPSGRGARIARVVPGLPGDQAGLVPGDVIFSVADVPTNGAAALFREVSRRPADSEVELLVARFGPGGGQPNKLTVRLGKKQLNLAKPGFSQIPEPTWRGMQADWATALPPNQLMFSQRRLDASLAVLRVDPDTPAWQAGLRPGQFIRTVNGQAVERPEAFYQQVEPAAGDVTLEIIGNDGRRQRVIVGAAEPPSREAAE